MRLSTIKNMQLKPEIPLPKEYGSMGVLSEKVRGFHQKEELHVARLSVCFLGFLFVSCVQAQFIVTPMQVELELKPGRQEKRVLALQNMDKFESHLVRLEAVELYQSKQGNWLSLDPNELSSAADELNLATHASCREWITLNQSSIEVPAYDKVYVPFTVRPTGNVRGFYCAGIRVRLLPREGVNGVVVRYDFVVPILVTMEGPTLRSAVELADAGLSYIESTNDHPATTIVTLNIKNSGATYSQLDPKATIWQVLDSGNTRLIKRDVAITKRAIIPGGDLTLAADLGARLPSGRYKIVGELNVDSRRVPGIERVVDFVNPTGRGIIHEEAAMRVDPPILELEMRPGRNRSGVISLFNSSQEDIVVKAVAEVPRGLAQIVAYDGQVRGEDISCADWIEIMSPEVPVRGERNRNIRLVVKMPNADKLARLNTQPSDYYATIRFYGFFRDGTSAGVETALVIVKNENVFPEYVVSPVSLKVESLGNSKFHLEGSFKNLSLTHIEPKCMANISPLSVQGLKTNLLRTDKLENPSAPKLMMPFETRSFAKEVDFSNIPQGTYNLEARLAYDYQDKDGNIQHASQPIQKQILVYVRAGEEERRVQVIGNSATPGANMGG